MSRTRSIPPVKAHVDPAKATERTAKRIRRKRSRGLLKPRVVAGTAAARALGIGAKKEDGE